MKKALKLTALSLALAFGSASFAQAADADKIAYVSVPVLLQSHPLVSETSEFGKLRKAEEDKLAPEEQKLAEAAQGLRTDEAALQKEGEALKASLDKKFAQLQKDAKDPKQRPSKLQEREKALNAESAAFQKKVAAFEKRANEHQQKVAAFQQKAGEAQQRLGAEEAKVRAEVTKNVKENIDKVAKEQGYTLVLDAAAVIYTANEGNDITEAVVKSFGGELPKAPKAPEAK
ncbi:periplasmic chaperone for outer membrane proteins Skp [Cricetibacter osteomyelitidis]|uniref:Periplasmic chaperone for outer membrane proteins Skp n=1 Tax=Cricetibacter osteomyelitidis TaxID=1521931 RepID=A0A4R2SWU3_9PAST|nr:OmpH family outer membrane protein [Cricetibacter osteomyelitidis]TCP94969.1 periplasmic chaperone for outer membrane proteins Skp [Cricetibacter osteomyelitidis]